MILMAKRKNTSDKLNWTTPMEDKLIEALVFHGRAGHKVNGEYTSSAYDEIVKESFPGLPFDKEKIKNKIKFIKSKFAPCYDIFKKYTSGFAWNSTTGLWEAEETVWEALIEAHPAAKEWRSKPIPHYDDMVEIWGADRATGDEAETAREIRERRANANPIDEIDNLIGRNEATLEAFDDNPENNLDDIEVDVQQMVESRKKSKSKNSKKEDDEVVKAFTRVAQALEANRFQLTKPAPRLVINGDDIWKHLVDLGFEDDDLDDAYLFLMDNSDNLEAIIGAPMHRRKRLLERMLQDK